MCHGVDPYHMASNVSNHLQLFLFMPLRLLCSSIIGLSLQSLRLSQFRRLKTETVKLKLKVKLKHAASCSVCSVMCGATSSP